MEALLRFFLFWKVFSSTSFGYPSGKISVACNSMLPSHENAISQTSLPPYAISISNTSFTPGDEIIVSLTGVNGSSFKGFLLQARTPGGEAAVGSFQILNPNTQGLICNNIQNSAVSHTNRDDKQNVTAVWIAPPGVGQVVFRATVVQSFATFWAQVQSHLLVSSNTPSVSTLPSLSQSTTPSATISTEEGCGTEKFCFSNPTGCSPKDPNCYFMSSEALESPAFKFEMSGLSDGYIAIGFSDDTIMGNDDIYICDRNATDHIEVQHAFSTGRTRPTPMPLGEVEVLATSFNNGIIRCSFISRNAISTQPRDAGNLYYIFLAFGPSSSGQILKHTRRPFITDQKVNISSFQSLGGTASTPLIIKAHGALMLIAWMTTGSVGMIFARYLKKSIKKTLLGKDIWFQIHLFFMLLTVVATSIAFILIFVAVKGWSDNAGAHAVIGCIVMVLSFFQPVIAFLRPSLTNNRRFVFNWFHMLNALVIKVLAVSAIFLGLQMLSNTSSQWMVKTMGGFVGWEALLAIMLDVNLWLKKKEIYEDPQPKVKNELLLLLIYLCGNLAFLIVLLVGIGRS
ncbi:putative ferric-chelate reductase 1 [Sceloporus undulatus]|uniref:putative ferric-chelate reductase 1 n=1 Tax=Sceloporus undulatus TaxID=8520 RepID=UPI001C4ADED5|nr:putative ferric-chelate reductase 1 [Sceloporus undulatus]XP_042319774.1 putative ferric-chelate reductase 1 [Sceloporus undulatus]XP_042319776.1 putative ferric-chelate reductase 1 [Sceloporus undulatus]